MSFVIVEVENNVTKNGATFMNGLQNRIKDAFDEQGAEIADIVEDTGWVDLSSYMVNTDCLSIRQSNNVDYKPMARRIGNQIFFKGEIYVSTAYQGKTINILQAIPSQFRPLVEFSTCGCPRETSTPYNMSLSTTGTLQVSQGSSLAVQSSEKGFQLTNLHGILGA